MKDEAKQAAGRPRPAIVASLAVSLAGIAAFAVQAQDGGPLVTLGLSFGAQYEANDPDEDESSFSTGLSLDYSRATRSQTFRLSSDGRFVYDETTDGIEFQRPSLALAYSTGTRATAFDVGLSYSVQDVDGIEEIIDPITGEIADLLDDDGELESLQLSAGLVTGQDARFGTDTQVSLTDRSYSGTSDPSLTDLESWRIGTTLRFEVDPRITLTASGSLRETRRDNIEETEERTTVFGLGGEVLIDPLWTGSASLQYSIFETEQGIGAARILTETDRLGFSVGISRAFRNGSLGLTVARDASEDGVLDSVSLSRSHDLRNGGALNWSLGLNAFPDGGVAPISSLSWTQPTPDGSFSVNLQQRATIDDDGDIVVTSLSMNYGQEINAVSGWSVNGSLTNVDNSAGSDNDQTRARIGLSYDRAVTRDWALSTSLSHNVTYAGDERDRSASVLSLSLRRSFSFRP
jgi:hypothetical protein